MRSAPTGLLVGIIACVAALACGQAEEIPLPSLPDAAVDSSIDSAIPDSGSSDAGATDGADDAPGDGPSEDGPVAMCTLQSCGGACCGASCLPRSCAACDAGIVFCATALGNGTCGNDCSTCSGGAIGCFACDPTPRGWCASAASDCPSDLTVCSCPSGDPAECPGENQVCDGFRCWSCGQKGQGPPNTDGEKCKNGKICDQPTATCK